MAREGTSGSRPGVEAARAATPSRPPRSEVPYVASPSVASLRWLMGLRLVVVSTLFLGALIIQTTTRTILPLAGLYTLFLASYCLSLGYLALHLKGISTRLQAASQLVGDIGLVTGLVYVTGGPYSPFSFLYLTVIVLAAVLLRGGGFIFAGLSAVTYGVLVDLVVFEFLPVPPNLVGVKAAVPASRVLYQLLINIVGFFLVALLVSYLTESLRTAHHRLEAEKERASRFVALTDHVVRSMGAGILAVDLEGRALHLNPAGARILKITNPEEVIGRAVEELMALGANGWSLLQARALARSPGRTEARLADGGARIGLSVRPLADEDGTPVGFVVNFQDLSEVEAELERRRVQDRMTAVGELASRMAHEIKNPLASISGSAQVLASLAGIDDTARRLLRIVVDESQRLSGILDGFLDYARPRQVSHQPCDLAELLRDCMDLLRRSGERLGNHTLTLDTPGRLVVFGDQDQLRQVFWNLSRNSIQAMPDGGTLTVSARAEANSVVLKWCDTGRGMSDEVRKRAFEPFVTTRPGGTGLGLAVVYAAVEEHGGSVNIQSSPGQGTTVVIELPLLEGAS